MTKEALWAIVPAAGIGSRMQADRPKQYLSLDGVFVIEQTLQRLASHPLITGIIVAIADNDPWWSQVSLPSNVDMHITTGGEQRADSVLNALNALSELTDTNPWVLVHDAARPCLRHADIDRMLVELSQHDVGGILGIPVNIELMGQTPVMVEGHTDNIKITVQQDLALASLFIKQQSEETV